MAATRTIGTTLTKKKSGSETEDLKVANLTSIGAIGLESEEIDVTDLDSPDDYKEFIAGTKDAGTVDLAGNIKNESIISAMLALAESRSIEEWTVTYKSGAKWVFNAYVSSFKDGEKTPDGVRFVVSNIDICGKKST